jgi:hypothetical protein
MNRKFRNLSHQQQKHIFLINSAEEAGRVSKNYINPHRREKLRVLTKGCNLDQLNDIEDQIDTQPKLIGSGIVKGFSSSGDKLSAVYGLLKRFTNKPLDEYITALSKCKKGGVGFVHIMSHAYDKLKLNSFLDENGIRYYYNYSRFGGGLKRMKKGDLYIEQNDEGVNIIRLLESDNIYIPLFEKVNGSEMNVEMETIVRKPKKVVTFINDNHKFEYEFDNNTKFKKQSLMLVFGPFEAPVSVKQFESFNFPSHYSKNIRFGKNDDLILKKPYLKNLPFLASKYYIAFNEVLDTLDQDGNTIKSSKMFLITDKNIA